VPADISRKAPIATFILESTPRMTDWQDCGHPNPASNYVFNSLTVYGNLYAATSGGKDEKDWRHVYRFMADKIGSIAARWATAKSKAWVR
jgi:hypothetical protein